MIAQEMVGSEHVKFSCAAPTGRPSIESELSMELQVAYDQQLVELGQASQRFLDRIAFVCERRGMLEGCDGISIAAALRELCVADEDVGGDPQPLKPKDVPSTLLPNGHVNQVDNTVGIPLNNGAMHGLHKRWVVDLDPSEHREMPIRSDSISHFSDMDSAQLDRMRQMFDIPKCKFIEASGKVHHPPSEFEAIAGPHLRHLYDRLHYKWCRALEHDRFMMRFVQSTQFKVTGAVVILLNFFFIIAQSDYSIWAEINGWDKKEADWMKKAEVVFTLYYVVELSCSIAAFRKDFFLGHDMSWNLFDFVIVFVAVVELLLTLVGGQLMKLSFLRVLRFFKIGRVLRMFSALRLVKDVKVMVDALTGSFMIFAFGCILLAMFLSVFSIFFVQGFAQFLANEGSVDASMRQRIMTDFGSVSTAMRSLFMSATGGDDWSKYHVTIKDLGVTYDFLYLFFIAFTMIAFFNIVTGVFAEKAMSLAVPTMEELTARRLNREVKDADELVKLLQRFLKTDTPGMISASAFDDFLAHNSVVAFFEVRYLKATTARRFFSQLLDIHKTDKIDLGTFISACIKLDGFASSIDLHALSVEVQTILMNQHALQEKLGLIAPPAKRHTGVCNVQSRRCASNGTENPPVATERAILPASPESMPSMAASAVYPTGNLQPLSDAARPNSDRTHPWKPSRAKGDDSDDQREATKSLGWPADQEESDPTLTSTNPGSGGTDANEVLM
jgi:hypothetical protein